MSRPSKKKSDMKKAEFFKEHIINGKSVKQCIEELGITRQGLSQYKKSSDFREMALMYLDESKLGGVQGTIDTLVGEFDSKNENIKHKALKEVIDIYGLHAPKRKDTTVTVSLSSDEDLFRQIDEAAKSCRFVGSHEVGKDGSRLVEKEQGCNTGNFESRERALLQDVALQEQK